MRNGNCWGIRVYLYYSLHISRLIFDPLLSAKKEILDYLQEKSKYKIIPKDKNEKHFLNIIFESRIKLHVLILCFLKIKLFF